MHYWPRKGAVDLTFKHVGVCPFEAFNLEKERYIGHGFFDGDSETRRRIWCLARRFGAGFGEKDSSQDDIDEPLTENQPAKCGPVRQLVELLPHFGHTRRQLQLDAMDGWSTETFIERRADSNNMLHLKTDEQSANFTFPLVLLPSEQKCNGFPLDTLLVNLQSRFALFQLRHRPKWTI